MISFEKIKNGIRYFTDPDFRFTHNAERGRYVDLPDEEFIKRSYRIQTGWVLNLENPRTFDEKIQWLKLHDKKPVYTQMVDKVDAKKYVADRIGEEFIIPTYGVWDRFDDIDFDKLPNQFVLKCAHDSGGNVIVKDKEQFLRQKSNVAKAKKKMDVCLKTDFFKVSREWPYQNVKRRILAEQYMEDAQDKELRDYKFFCFNGKIGVLLICTSRQVELEETWFDEDFHLLDLTESEHKRRKDLKKPQNFEQMKEIARMLSQGIPFVRVDLYNVNGKIYFGELSFYPAGGFEKFHPEEWNLKLGNMIDLGLAKDGK